MDWFTEIAFFLTLLRSPFCFQYLPLLIWTMLFSRFWISLFTVLRSALTHLQHHLPVMSTTAFLASVPEASVHMLVVLQIFISVAVTCLRVSAPVIGGLLRSLLQNHHSVCFYSSPAIPYLEGKCVYWGSSYIFTFGKSRKERQRKTDY